MGAGLGAGVRRNVKQMSKRLRAFVARRHKFKMLRKSRGFRIHNKKLERWKEQRKMESKK